MLAHTITFDPQHSADLLAAIPAKPGVFLLRGHAADAEPYVSKSSDLRRRLTRLLAPPEAQSKRLNLRDRVASIEYSLTGSDFESALLLYDLLRRLDPTNYRKRLKLGSVPLVKLAWENAYPRAYVTRRLGKLGGKSLYYGPFASRATAEKFLNDILDLFKTRRCHFDLNPDPAFPGCVYSEMKMCLAPCFRGCTDDEYVAEVHRLESFLDSRGGSLVKEIASARDDASERMDFEQAAALHAKFEKAHAPVAGLPELIHRIDQLAGTIIQPAAEKDHVAIFLCHAGALTGPFLFPLQPPDPLEKKSLEARISEFLAALPSAEATSSSEAADHLSLLKRWYYRSSRVGEIFFSGSSPRRIANGVSRVARGEKPVPMDPSAGTPTISPAAPQ